MRWRLVDRVEALEPWESIRASRCVSLEESFLTEPLGERGFLPESLLLECLVETARWLVVCSSGFETSGVLAEVDDLRFLGRAGMGTSLGLRLSVEQRDEGAVKLLAEGRTPAGLVVRGRLGLRLLPLEPLVERGLARELWQEVHASPR